MIPSAITVVVVVGSSAICVVELVDKTWTKGPVLTLLMQRNNAPSKKAIVSEGSTLIPKLTHKTLDDGNYYHYTG